MISVERIKQFMHIPSEPSGIIDGEHPPTSWPSMGKIELKDVMVRITKFVSLHYTLKFCFESSL